MRILLLAGSIAAVIVLATTGLERPGRPRRFGSSSTQPPTR